MNYNKIIKQLSLIKDDSRSEDRYEALKARGVSNKHYLNQIAASKGDKKFDRASTFYRLAKEDGNESLANEIKSQYPDLYASQEERDKETRLENEAKEKARLDAEAKKPINILIKNMEETKHAPTYGMSDEQVEDLQDSLYNELVPSSGPADTLAGELLRAFNDLMYRWWNDNDWVAKNEGFNGNESFSPRSVSNMKFLTTHGAGQVSIFFDQALDRAYGAEAAKIFQNKVNRMLLNQIVKKKLYEVPNSEDSRETWRRGH